MNKGLTWIHSCFVGRLFSLSARYFSTNKKKGFKIIHKLPEVTKKKISPAIKEEIGKDVLLKPNQEVQKLPINSRSSGTQFMKYMDSSFEGFFYQRPYTLQNFNFLLQILNQQHKSDESLVILERMKEMRIEPRISTYAIIMASLAKARRVDECEALFKEVKQSGLVPQQTIYTSLMLAYAKKNDPITAQKVLREMKEAGLEPDSATLTTLIDAYKRADKIQKCWQIFEEYQPIIDYDEFIVSYMMRLCAATHDAEKALKLRMILDGIGFMEYAANYNSLIFALASRKDYAREAIETWERLLLHNVTPDYHTYVGVLKACHHLGDVNAATHALKAFKIQGFKMNQYMYNGLFRVYAGAVLTPQIDEATVQMYLDDSLRLFSYMSEVDQIAPNIYILNSLLLLHCNALRTKEVEQRILPMFSRLNIPYNLYTFQILMNHYTETQDFDRVLELYEKMKDRGIQGNKMIMNQILKISAFKGNTDIAVHCLREMQERKIEPYMYLLRRIWDTKNMPDRLYVEMVKYRHFLDNTKRGHRRFKGIHKGRKVDPPMQYFNTSYTPHTKKFMKRPKQVKR